MNADEYRILRSRQAELRRDLDRRPSPPVGNARMLVTVSDIAAIDGTPDRYYDCLPTVAGGPEVHGGAGTFEEGDRSLPVLVVGWAPVFLERLIARSVDGRWVAEREGSPCPPHRYAYAIVRQCHSGFGPFGDGRPSVGATVEMVEESTGQVVNTGTTAMSVYTVAVLNGGSGYDDANPPPVSFGSGNATAEAVVIGGQVVSIDVTGPGSGYPTSGPAPTVIIGGPGSGAVAVASIQPMARLDVMSPTPYLIRVGKWRYAPQLLGGGAGCTGVAIQCTLRPADGFVCFGDLDYPIPRVLYINGTPMAGLDNPNIDIGADYTADMPANHPIPPGQAGTAFVILAPNATITAGWIVMPDPALPGQPSAAEAYAACVTGGTCCLCPYPLDGFIEGVTITPPDPVTGSGVVFQGNFPITGSCRSACVPPLPALEFCAPGPFVITE